MFKIAAEPTFDASLTIVGQGREQTLNVTFNAMPASEYRQMFKDISDGSLAVPDALLRILKSWDADAELSKATLEKLQDHQPGSDWAILTGYGDALAVARKGN